ncbi:MAG: 4-hydroxy-tetrahydrodipicolinate synthase [Thaumarchaeota archaeon]|nr:4-hydroxy-tetrahydrodipicolinate synthase [Nitrososphaerota archaeon]
MTRDTLRGQKKVGGLVTALLTPFDQNGGVDGRALARLVRFQIDKGVDGLYPCGTTGLGPMLNVDERKQVAETVVKEASGKVPVIVQVGSADTASTVALAKHAERIGADAVASLTPYYYKPGENATVKHFEAISRSIGIPLFAYNIPQFTGNNLRPSVVSSMAKTGTISGIKDSSRDFLQLQEIIESVPEGFTVMNGTEEYALFALMIGAAGLVSGGANAFPEAMKALVVAQREGDYQAALAAHWVLLKIKDATSAGPIPAYYEVLRKRGIDCGSPRPPILPLDVSAAKKVMRDLSPMRLWQDR